MIVEPALIAEPAMIVEPALIAEKEPLNAYSSGLAQPLL